MWPTIALGIILFAAVAAYWIYCHYLTKAIDMDEKDKKNKEEQDE